jgi:hypothetical protein
MKATLLRTALPLALVSLGCGATACRPTPRQMDIAEVYAATIDVSKLQRGLGCEAGDLEADDPKLAAVCAGLQVREDYARVLQLMAPDKYMAPCKRCEKLRKARETLLKDINEYKERLRTAELFGDMRIAQAARLSFQVKLKGWCPDKEQLMDIIDASTSLLKQIDALVDEQLETAKHFSAKRRTFLRESNALLTDTHFRAADELSARRFCRGARKRHCQELYNDIYGLGKALRNKDELPSRPCWTKCK